MDEKEWLVWCDANERLWGVDRSESPCRDCLPLFHADMVAGGQCDGTPLPGERDAAKVGPKVQYHEHTYAELKAMRAAYSRFGAPQSLLVEVRRAYWRERDRGRRTRAARRARVAA
jgi:hypothetical protein